MQDLLTNLQEEIHYTDKEIFIKIWTQPRQIFKYINDKQYYKYVTLLLVLAGIANSFDKATSKNMGDSMNMLSIIGLSIVGGALFGWISFYIYASLVSWTGKWLDGQSDTMSIVRIMAYASIPSIVAMLLIIPSTIIYGIDNFRSLEYQPGAGKLSNMIYYIIAIIEFTLGIWTMVLYVVGISEVQKISIGKAIVNLILPIVIIIVPILLIFAMFFGFNLF